MDGDSVILSWEKYAFPNIVGLEEFRAKALIRYWLKVFIKYDEDIYFRMYDYKQKRALTSPTKDAFGNIGNAKVVQGSKEVILWYDYKFDAVAITPVWYGEVEYLKDTHSIIETKSQ